MWRHLFKLTWHVSFRKKDDDNNNNNSNISVLKNSNKILVLPYCFFHPHHLSSDPSLLRTEVGIRHATFLSNRFYVLRISYTRRIPQTFNDRFASFLFAFQLLFVHCLLDIMWKPNCRSQLPWFSFRHVVRIDH